MFYSCVNMIFWRVFMRISYTCPAHLKFPLTVEKWTTLVRLTGDAIDWLDANERTYDVWVLVAYCATSCALVQVSSDTKPCYLFLMALLLTGFPSSVPHLGPTARLGCPNEAQETP